MTTIFEKSSLINCLISKLDMVKLELIKEPPKLSVKKWDGIPNKERIRRINQEKLLRTYDIDDITCTCDKCKNLAKKIRAFYGTFFTNLDSLKNTRFGVLSAELQKSLQPNLDSIKDGVAGLEKNLTKALEVQDNKRQKDMHKLIIDNIVMKISNVWNEIIIQEQLIRNDKAKSNNKEHINREKKKVSNKNTKIKKAKDRIIKLVIEDKVKLASGSHISKKDNFCGNMDYDKEDLENHDPMWFHRTRKSTDSTKNHSTSRDILLRWVSSCCDDSANPETFKLMPKISGNKKDRTLSIQEDPNSVEMCCKCPVEKCDMWISIKGVIRKLFALPPQFKTKKKHAKDPKMEGAYQKYIDRVRTMEANINKIEYKKRRYIRIKELQKNKPKVVECMYCDVGVGHPIDPELKQLEEYIKEQESVRTCDECNITFCGKLNKNNNKICGERYFIGDPYVTDEEKSDDPKIDHRKNTCLAVRAIRDQDINMIEISKSSIECPKCGNGVSKIDGCNRMTCRCGQNFCWQCGVGFKSANAVYTHIDTCIIKRTKVKAVIEEE